ncbi:GCN5 family acetyltransferase [Flavobacterium sp. Root935]|jgi:GNAT superfamily N-acetyltransferase|uniref:GNAT family N-acetyltransferase n=1 Tax=unclassified Flavobacterium TaxID=196869 RepID=UPI000711198F|nr:MULTISPECIES: GNAT family N-acetyltransferase [unclassified Flavobacterium]KRD61212.1 GCN5 family acetyltransferase [Flavobacterium sp. Root935]TDX09710.1 acetyltransferase (GNAT) family protein [Flavobacterium sp. S87F.05.LMB.W.Kidney.N]
MTNRNLIKDNIDNLTALWRTVATPLLSYHKFDPFEFSQIKNSGWPNRLWFREDIKEENLPQIMEIMEKNPGLVIPYWDIFGSNSSEFFENKGFKIRIQLMAMALKLNKKFTLQNKLNFKRVLNEEDAKTWSDIYPLSFSYVISKETLVHNYENVKFYLVHFEEKPIGTLTLFQTGNIMGIHGVGVIPEMRKKGFAEEIMKFALNEAIDAGCEYAQLQASALGKGIYTRLGFEDLFLITNYQLK